MSQYYILLFLFYCIVLYYTLLYFSLLYFTILYFSLVYFTILYFLFIYFTIPYYSILCFTILYFTLLYYRLMYICLGLPFPPLLRHRGLGAASDHACVVVSGIPGSGKSTCARSVTWPWWPWPLKRAEKYVDGVFREIDHQAIETQWDVNPNVKEYMQPTIWDVVISQNGGCPPICG